VRRVSRWITAVSRRFSGSPGQLHQAGWEFAVGRSAWWRLKWQDRCYSDREQAYWAACAEVAVQEVGVELAEDASDATDADEQLEADHGALEIWR
jgi:hypothetical protein